MGIGRFTLTKPRKIPQRKERLFGKEAGNCLLFKSGKMQLRPIHHGLSTSFVDLPALVRHLRDLQFVGTIRLELSGYEGEIVFTSAGKIHARDHDLAMDKTSEGDRAFRNILLKSRDSFGQIHVFHGATELHVSKNLYVDELIRHAALQTVTSRN